MQALLHLSLFNSLYGQLWSLFGAATDLWRAKENNINKNSLKSMKYRRMVRFSRRHCACSFIGLCIYLISAFRYLLLQFNAHQRSNSTWANSHTNKDNAKTKEKRPKKSSDIEVEVGKMQEVKAISKRLMLITSFLLLLMLLLTFTA